jgi:5-methylthioadenosine/S-adenosylhomocysteine deaminase
MLRDRGELTTLDGEELLRRAGFWREQIAATRLEQ